MRRNVTEVAIRDHDGRRIVIALPKHLVSRRLRIRLAIKRWCRCGA